MKNEDWKNAFFILLIVAILLIGLIIYQNDERLNTPQLKMAKSQMDSFVNQFSNVTAPVVICNVQQSKCIEVARIK